MRYKARDGAEIRGFLTLPKDMPPQKLPAIIFPHGGPISSDDTDFDYWTEFLANRGYAVLQMDFRGSAGYGHDFMVAGLKQWGLQMQDDIVDGTRWLIDGGVADPQRICIVGASYGGYAALMGAARYSGRSVPFRQSELMADALKDAGKPYEFIEQEGGDHHLSNYRHRLQLFEAMERFLDRNLAPVAMAAKENQ